MKLFGDYHTHTPYSHGKGSIDENTAVAKEKGLKEIAITDHGFEHKLYAVKRENISKMRNECLKAQEKYGIKVLLGIEANLLGENGEVDITKEEYDKLDLLIVGWHNFVKTKGFKNKFSFFFMNYIFNVIGTPKWKRNKNTKAYIEAIQKYPIDIISHLNYGMKTNTLEVAKFARDHGVLIELNGKRIKFSKREIEEMVKEKVKFIVNSDAHKKENVGKNDVAFNLIAKYNIPSELVVNLDNLAKFKKSESGEVWVFQLTQKVKLFLH